MPRLMIFLTLIGTTILVVSLLIVWVLLLVVQLPFMLIKPIIILAEWFGSGLADWPLFLGKVLQNPDSIAGLISWDEASLEGTNLLN